jgi:signal peptide peptidase SppA
VRYSQIAEAFWRTPWAILPEKLAELRAFLIVKLRGDDVDPAEVARAVASRREIPAPPEAGSGARRPGQAIMAGRVGIVPVMGVISQRLSMLSEASGGCGTDAIGNALDDLVADRQCQSIILQFDSPGGSVFGVSELASKIRSLRGEKKIVGIADSLAASAAYWLLSQCSEVVITSGGQVGSIGVIAAHEDQSAADEQAGVKTTLVASSTYKAEGSPFAPLDDEAKAEMQSKVDYYHSAFVNDVAKGRGVSVARVNADFGQGRMVTAKDAAGRGMADRVQSMQQLLTRLTGGDAGAGTARPTAEDASPELTAAIGIYQRRADQVDAEARQQSPEYPPARPERRRTPATARSPVTREQARERARQVEWEQRDDGRADR